MPQSNHQGYLNVKPNLSGGVKSLCISHLAGLTFPKNPQRLPQIDYIDENKKNNYVANLRWISTLDNIQHSCGKKVMKISDAGNDLGIEFPSIASAAASIGVVRKDLVKYVCQ